MSLFAFGLGYCAARVISRGRLGAAAGTVRTADAVGPWRDRGVAARLFADAAPLPPDALALVSIPPDEAGDPTLREFGARLRDAGLRRVIYLSTVGVYGDSAGAWVDEETLLRPATARAQARAVAEAEWRAFGRDSGVAVDILRLGGIYGPGRSGFQRLREGTARRVVKPGQVFNRIHVDDIAAAVEAAAAAGGAGDVYNVVDGAPAPPQDVVAYGAELLGLSPPPEEAYESVALTGMAASFYEENRRVRNDKLRRLGWAPRYPSYREGLAATLAEERR